MMMMMMMCDMGFVFNFACPGLQWRTRNIMERERWVVMDPHRDTPIIRTLNEGRSASWQWHTVPYPDCAMAMAMRASGSSRQIFVA